MLRDVFLAVWATETAPLIKQQVRRYQTCCGAILSPPAHPSILPVGNHPFLPLLWQITSYTQRGNCFNKVLILLLRTPQQYSIFTLKKQDWFTVILWSIHKQIENKAVVNLIVRKITVRLTRFKSYLFLNRPSFKIRRTAFVDEEVMTFLVKLGMMSHIYRLTSMPTAFCAFQSKVKPELKKLSSDQPRTEPGTSWFWLLRSSAVVITDAFILSTYILL